VEHSLLLVIEARPKAIVISKRNAHVTAGISTSLSYDNKKNWSYFYDRKW